MAEKANENKAQGAESQSNSQPVQKEYPPALAVFNLDKKISKASGKTRYEGFVVIEGKQNKIVGFKTKDGEGLFCNVNLAGA